MKVNNRAPDLKEMATPAVPARPKSGSWMRNQRLPDWFGSRFLLIADLPCPLKLASKLYCIRGTSAVGYRGRQHEYEYSNRLPPAPFPNRKDLYRNHRPYGRRDGRESFRGA